MRGTILARYKLFAGVGGVLIIVICLILLSGFHGSVRFEKVLLKTSFDENVARFEPPTAEKRSTVAPLKLVERKIFSQYGEDGVLFDLFDWVGTTNKFYAEFGVQDGSERCTRALQEQRGWKGLLLDGSHSNPQINLLQEYVKAETIRSVFHKNSVPQDLDLLVIDIDGNDYYAWWALCASGESDQTNAICPEMPKLEALPNFKPRVVVIEFNARWAPPDDRVVEYMQTKDVSFVPTEYFGASISAYVRLGKLMGYTLVYCESNGVNLFFVRSDIAATMGENFGSLETIYRKPTYNNGLGWVGPIPAGRKWIFCNKK